MRMEAPKKQNVNLSVVEKIKILDRMKSGEQRQKILAETGMSRKTLERMVTNEEKIRESATEIDTSRKRPNRQGKNDEVEDALGKWFTAVGGKKQSLDQCL